PPRLHFSQDISGLFSEWESSDLLVVNGRKIPVKYWGQFYKKTKGAKVTAWSTIRNEWGNWKFIVEEMQSHASEDEFWRKFSDSEGRPLSYKQILTQIFAQRTTSISQDASDARAFFGGDLDHPNAQGAFRYNKTGKSYLFTKDEAIAKKWRHLLNTQPDLAAQW
ncbi:hypothetical protein BJ138DRAFT_987513, partial [Hygrophoropsis aurantiaca]